MALPIANQIRRLRFEHGEMTQSDLAEKIGMTRQTVAAIEANGGTILMPPAVIPTVGELIYFKDSEGNIAGAMKYETS